MSDLSLLRRMWPFVKPDAWALVLALVATPIIAALNLAQPYLLKIAIDQHIAPGVLEGLGTVVLIYLGSVLLVYLLDASYTLAVAWAGQRSILRLRSSLYRHVLSLAQRYFDRNPAGALLTRLTSDMDALGEALGAGVVTIGLDLLLIVGILSAMLWLNPGLTLVLLALSPILLIVLNLLRRRLRALFLTIREAIADVNAFIAERVDGVQTVQLNRCEELAAEQFDVPNRRFRNATTTSNIYDALMYAVVDGTSSICVAVILVVGGGLLAGYGLEVPGVTAGLVVAFIDYLDRLFRPLRELSSKIAVIQRATAALSKIFGVFDEGEPAESGANPVPAVRGHLVLSDVRFSYRSDGEDVLRGVDLEVKPGEVVAIVGATGSGKTTLTRLLDRSYTGYRGSITLDGRELADLDTAQLRRHIAGVRQDVQLFSETVRFNVDLGNPVIIQEQCREAAALVHADHFVNRLGWRRILHERGADLSVGEGQLLTFARAMAHDPEVIILDEATASIDSLTEQLIQDAIARIFERKTVIVIAHRLSTIQEADRIAVMADGQVIEQGSHDELLAADGAYAALIHAADQGMVA